MKKTIKIKVAGLALELGFAPSNLRIREQYDGMRVQYDKHIYQLLAQVSEEARESFVKGVSSKNAGVNAELGKVHAYRRDTLIRYLKCYADLSGLESEERGHFSKPVRDEVWNGVTDKMLKSVETITKELYN